MSNTLDDLILPEEEPEEKNSKSILALLALVVLLIIVGAILAKMIFATSDDNSTLVKSNKLKVSEERKIVKPETKTKETRLNKSEDLAPINDNDVDLAPIDNDNVDSSLNAETIDIDDNKVDKKSKAEVNSKNSDKENSIANDLNVAPVNKDKVVASREVKEKKVVHHKPKPKPKPKPDPKPKKHIYGGSGNVYIQVGSFAKGPEKSFINKIRRAGFKYRIKTGNGLRRVFVGPFESRSDAKNILGIVRSKISSQAFIK